MAQSLGGFCRAVAILALGSLLAASLASGQSLFPGHPHPVQRPLPLLVVPEARIPVRLERATVRTLIVGTMAKTRIEFVLYNPNERVLEGELKFPLLERQTVTGLALDIDGRLRDAVAVPKAKGRQVFDDVSRQQVDPALLQVDQGNNYSLRIYPLPARGRRQVALELTEPLDSGRGKSGLATFRLPLNFAEKIGTLDVEVSLPGVRPGSVSANWRTSRLAGEDKPGGTVLRLRASAVEGGGELVVQRGRINGTFVSTQQFRGNHYFYVEVPVSSEAQPRPAPRSIGLVWDASGSGAKRARDRELAVLDEYFRRLGRVDVTLRVVRDVAEPDERFEVRSGQWDALRKRLASMVYDGASNPGLMSPSAGSDLGLLVTDGLFNYGGAPLPESSVPLMVLSSGVGPDLTTLRRKAEASGGELIDLDGLLARLSHSNAALEGARLLTRQRTRLATLDGRGTAELVAASRYDDGGRIVVAGVLLQPTAELHLGFVSASGAGTTTKVRLVDGAGSGARGTAVAAQHWARLRWSELAEDALRNAAAKERLGLQFSLLTPQTSLIVLDNAAQYARYGIEPPDSEPQLLAEYEATVATGRFNEDRARASQLTRVTREFEERVQWWNREYPKDEPPKPAVPKVSAAVPMPTGAPAPMPTGAPPAPPPPAPAAAMAAAEQTQRERSERRSVASPAAAANAAANGGTVATISLKKWAADSVYARRLRAAAPQDVYAIYLDERPNYENSTAFFLDAADILLEKQQPALAARVVSNLAEMKLEDRQILRILAYRLMQFGETALALPVLQRVLALAPDEPQSWRDLALAQAAGGQYQQAVDGLWHVVAQPWQDRFPGIELIALTELNAIVAQAQATGARVDTSAIPPALLKNLPVAMRTVLAWDADNTDIDLWVTDPNGERAYYGHRETYQGGRMSRDFVGGYGPEEFSLRNPKPGKYRVQAQFYGHRQQIVAPATTLMLQFTTDFGTPAETQRSVILRLAGREEVIEVGEFEVKASGSAAVVGLSK